MIVLFFCITLIHALTPMSDCKKTRISYYSGYESGGSCQFPPTTTKVVPGYMFFAAANEKFYDSSNKCGICYEMVGPKGAVRFMVTDLCPNGGKYCSGDMIHIDLADNAFPYVADKSSGVVNTTMRMVACDHTGNVKIVSRPGTNEWWFSFVVTNHAVGIKKVYIGKESTNSWTQLQRSKWNNWTAKGKVTVPCQVKIEGITGETVIVDVKSTAGSTTHVGRKQFSIPKSGKFNIETLAKVSGSPKEECCSAPDEYSTIYDDALRGSWTDQSWSCANSFSYSSARKVGKYSFRSQMSGWAGIQLISRIPAPKEQYDKVEFYLRAETACSGGILINGIRSGAAGKRIYPKSVGTWEKFSLNIKDLGVSSKGIEGFMFQNYASASNTILLDDIKLIKKSSLPDSGICVGYDEC